HVGHALALAEAVATDHPVAAALIAVVEQYFGRGRLRATVVGPQRLTRLTVHAQVALRVDATGRVHRAGDDAALTPAQGEAAEGLLLVDAAVTAEVLARDGGLRLVVHAATTIDVELEHPAAGRRACLVDIARDHVVDDAD